MQLANLHFRAIQKLTEQGFKLEKLEERGRFLARLGQGRDSKKVQIKTRIGIYKGYEGKNLNLCFPVNCHGDERWYLVPHDTLIEIVGERTPWLASPSWEDSGIYHSPNPSIRLIEGLADFELR